MIQYRAYHVGKDDRYKVGFNLNCADDQEAIAVAKRLANSAPAEEAANRKAAAAQGA